MDPQSDEQIERIASAVVRQVLSQTTRFAKDDASDLIKTTAITAVNEAHIRLFSNLGYDIANRDDIKRLRSNLDFIDKLRMGSAAAGQALTTAIAIAVVGFIGAILWLGARLSLGTAPHGK